MNKILAVLLTGLFATASFAQAAKPVEAQKPGSAAPAAAAQGKVDAKPMAAAPAAAPMEAQKSGSAKAEAKAEMKKDDKIATKPKKAKKAKSNKPVKAG